MITLNTDSTFTQVKLDNPLIFALHNATVAEVIDMTTQHTVEKPTASLNTKRGDEACAKTEKLADLLLSAVDETLKEVFKEAGAEVIYKFLGNKCHLKREEIADKTEDFSAGLEKLLGSATPVIEKMILKSLYAKLQLKYVEKEGYGFSDYLRKIERNKMLKDKVVQSSVKDVYAEK